MARSEMYRHHAEECLRLADAQASSEHRAVLIDMARHWHELAQIQERRARLECIRLPGSTKPE